MRASRVCYKWMQVAQALRVPCCRMINLWPLQFQHCQQLYSTNYAPIEKECLAIKVACTKFYLYLYGKQDAVVHSDHQPLETIFKTPVSKAYRRLKCMLLQLQP